MNNFKGGGFKNGGLKFGGKKKHKDNKGYAGGGQRRDNRPTGGDSQLFSAVCSECTNKCEVPFRPSPDKPVYCSACFGMKKSANESRGSVSNSNRGEKGSYKNERSDYKKQSHEQSSPRPNVTQEMNNNGIADLKRQISGLEQKLNRILDLINPPMPAQKVPVPENKKAVKKVVKKTPAKTATKKVSAKKVVKKTVKKAAPKKAAAKKVPAKKATKKAVKKVVKKTVKKVAKKSKK